MTNEDKLAQLDSKFASKVRALISQSSKLGYSLIIVSGKRSAQDQEALYAQGRTKPGKIVTYLRGIGPNASKHVLGLAVDLFDASRGYQIDYRSLSVLAKSQGINWGGDFSGFPDNSHFENNPNVGGTMPDQAWWQSAPEDFKLKHIEAVRQFHLGLLARNPDVEHWKISPDLHIVAQSIVKGAVVSGEIKDKLPELNVTIK